MPISCKYKSDKNVLYCKAKGVVTLEDFQQLMREIVTSTEYSPDVHTLWDMRELDFNSITKDLADQLIALRKKNPQRGQSRIVIIADKDRGFGLSRMYEMLSLGLPQEIMVFRDFEEGEEWLLRE